MQKVELKSYFDMSQQRWKDMAAGKPAYGSSTNPDTLAKDADPITKEYWEYYKTPEVRKVYKLKW